MSPAPLTAFCDGCMLKIHAVCGGAQERLREMGLREGADVEIVKNSGDIIVRIEGCRIGLRCDMAVDVLAIPTSS